MMVRIGGVGPRDLLPGCLACGAATTVPRSLKGITAAPVVSSLHQNIEGIVEHKVGRKVN